MFQKEQSWTASIFHIIEPGLHKPWMPDEYLDAGFELALIPGLPILRRRLRGEDGRPDAGLAQYRFDPAGDIPLLCVRRIDLDAAPVLNLRLDQLKELSFFSVKDGFIEVRRIRDQEALAPFGFFIVCEPQSCPIENGRSGYNNRALRAVLITEEFPRCA